MPMKGLADVGLNPAVQRENLQSFGNFPNIPYNTQIEKFKAKKLFSFQQTGHKKTPPDF